MKHPDSGEIVQEGNHRTVRADDAAGVHPVARRAR